MMSDEWPRAGDVIWIVEGSGACLRYVWSDNHTFAGMLRGYARQGRMFKSHAEASVFAKTERTMAREGRIERRHQRGLTEAYARGY